MLLAVAGCGSGGAPSAGQPEPEVTFGDEARPPASPAVLEAERLLASGEAEAAARVLREAVAESPTDGRALLDLGLALEMQGRVEDAEAAYERATEAAPGLAEASNNLGVLRRERGDLEGAVAALRQAVQADPALASAHLNLGLALEEADRRVEAEAAYRRAMTLAPTDPSPRVQLGLLLVALEQRAEALGVLRPAVDLAAGDRALLSALGNGLRRAGDPQMAVRALREAIGADDDPAPPPVRAELALALYAAEHPEQAEAELGTLLAEAPDYAVGHYLLGHMLAQRGADREAARAFARYLDLEPEGPQAERARARLRELAGRRP
ncbi:MAG: tetratricopeptide repeat protein [Sandaracinaceae bacterium]